MKINSKIKGKTGELEWANFCKKHGFDVRRSQQYCGKTEESADCIGLPGIHQEVKRRQNLNLDDALEKSDEESGMGINKKFPIIAHRKDRKKWKVTMYAKDWFDLYREYKRVFETNQNFVKFLNQPEKSSTKDYHYE